MRFVYTFIYIFMFGLKLMQRWFLYIGFYIFFISGGSRVRLRCFKLYFVFIRAGFGFISGLVEILFGNGCEGLRVVVGWVG